jgi:hypothetical protein
MKSSDAEMKERKALVGSTTTMTFFSQAIAHLGLDAQGRHAAAAKVSVSGVAPFVKYPKMPSGSPWAEDLSGVEPPLGWSVEAQEAVGEPHELAASIVQLPEGDEVANEATAAETSTPLTAGAEAPAAGSLSPQAAGVSSLLRGRRL